MKIAVLGVAVAGNKLLAVSRKHKPSKIGLVGGKVDEGEEMLEALKREVQEEIGKILPFVGPLIYKAQVQDFLVCTYLIDVSPTESLTPEMGGSIYWLEAKDFVAQSEFASYNEELVQTLRHRQILK